MWRNYRRTFITSASIFFSILLAIVMTSMQEGSYDQMIKNTVGMYSGYIQVQGNGYWDDKTLEKSFEADKNLIQKLDSMPGITHYVPRLESFVLASTGEFTKGSMVVGMDPEKEKMLMNPEKNLIAGAYLSRNDNGVLVASGLAENIKATVGDTVVLFGMGYHGINAAGKYPIRGIIKMPSPQLNKQLLFISVEEAQYLFGAYGRLTALSLIIEDTRHAQRVANTMQSVVDTTAYDVMAWQEMNPDLIQTIEADRGGGYIMLIILYIVVGFGVLGTVIMMTLERRREFGILIGIGMHPVRITVMMIGEIFLMSVMGIIAGTAVALPITLWYNRNPVYFSGRMAEMMAEYGMEAILPFSVEPSIYLTQAIIVFFIAMLTVIYPISKILTQPAVSATKG